MQLQVIQIGKISNGFVMVIPPQTDEKGVQIEPSQQLFSETIDEALVKIKQFFN